MHRKILIPRTSRLFPNKGQRILSANRNALYPKEMFHTYQDWFYFMHIDPAQRYLHAFGMYVGTIFFLLMATTWSLYTIVYYLLGVFFFYVVGIISHLIYDMGTARSEPRYLMATFGTVIMINLKTSFGSYDKSLRSFVEKYPFVTKAYDLIEIDKGSVIKHLLK